MLNKTCVDCTFYVLDRENNLSYCSLSLSGDRIENVENTCSRFREVEVIGRE